VNSSAVSVVVFKVALIVLPIGKQNLYLPVNNFESIKASFYYLIRQTEKNTIAIWLSVTPLTLENGTCLPKFTKPSTMTQIGLPIPLVDVAVRQDYLA